MKNGALLQNDFYLVVIGYFKELDREGLTYPSSTVAQAIFNIYTFLNFKDKFLSSST